MGVCQIKYPFFWFILDFLFDTTIDYDKEYTAEKAIKDFNHGNITFNLKTGYE